MITDDNIKQDNSHVCSINIFVNRICNLNCTYCYVNKKGDVLDKVTITDIVNYLSPLVNKFDSEFHIGFLGGEPLISKNIIENICYKLIAGTDTKVSFGITTNGTLINSDAIDLFRRFNMRVVLSLDGDDTAMSNRCFLSNSLSSYQSVIKGLKILQESSINYLVQMTITPYNITAFAKNVEHVVNIGASKIMFGFDVTCRWHPHDLVNLRDQLDNVFQYYYSLLSSGRDISIKYIDNECIAFFASSHDNYTGSAFACSAGCNVIAIDTTGKIYPCQNFVNYSEAQIGNVKDGINTNLLNDYLSQAKASVSYCSDCTLVKFCRRCPAGNIAQNASIRKMTYISCELGKITYDLICKFLPSFLKLPIFRSRLGSLASSIEQSLLTTSLASKKIKIVVGDHEVVELWGKHGAEEEQSYLLEINGKRILIDAGVLSTDDAPPDCCIVTHGHTRNTKSASILTEYYPNTPIFMSKPTYELIDLLINKNTKNGCFINNNITIVSEQRTDIPGINIDFFCARHIVGNIGFKIQVGNRKLLWAAPATSSRADDQLPGFNFQSINDVDVAIIDGKYLSYPLICENEYDGLIKLINTVNSAVIANKSVLICVSAVGRAQIILDKLLSSKNMGCLSKYADIFCTSKINDVNLLYKKYGIDISSKDDYSIWAEDNINLKAREVLVAETRCLYESSVSGRVYENLKNNENALVILTGFAINGSPLDDLLTKNVQTLPYLCTDAKAQHVLIPFADHLQSEEVLDIINLLPEKCKLWFLDGNGRLVPWIVAASSSPALLDCAKLNSTLAPLKVSHGWSLNPNIAENPNYSYQIDNIQHSDSTDDKSSQADNGNAINSDKITYDFGSYRKLII